MEGYANPSTPNMEQNCILGSCANVSLVNQRHNRSFGCMKAEPVDCGVDSPRVSRDSPCKCDALPNRHPLWRDDRVHLIVGIIGGTQHLQVNTSQPFQSCAQAARVAHKYHEHDIMYITSPVKLDAPKRDDRGAVTFVLHAQHLVTFEILGAPC